MFLPFKGYNSQSSMVDVYRLQNLKIQNPLYVKIMETSFDVEEGKGADIALREKGANG